MSIKDVHWKNNHAVLKIMMPEICAFLFAFCHLLFSVEIVDSYISCCCCRTLERDGGRPGMKPANRGWYPSPMYRYIVIKSFSYANLSIFFSYCKSPPLTANKKDWEGQNYCSNCVVFDWRSDYLLYWID